MKKYLAKGGWKRLTVNGITLEAATATDAEVEQLRKDRPDTFNTYFEEAKAPKVAEPAQKKAEKDV